MHSDTCFDAKKVGYHSLHNNCFLYLRKVLYKTLANHYSTDSLIWSIMNNKKYPLACMEIQNFVDEKQVIKVVMKYSGGIGPNMNTPNSPIENGSLKIQQLNLKGYLLISSYSSSCSAMGTIYF